MDHNQIQKAIDEYNFARQEALKAYTQIVNDQQAKLLSEISHLTESGPLNEVEAEDENGSITLTKDERDRLYKQLEIANNIIKQNPSLNKS